MDLLEDYADENMDFGPESEVMPMELSAVKRGRKQKPRRGDSYKMVGIRIVSIKLSNLL